MILIVDDHQQVADGLAEALSATGYGVVVCYDVESAEIVVRNANVSAIVCDIRLSGPFRFEGLDFLDYVRRHAPRAQVALISGNVTADIRAESLRRGADLILAKPFSIDDLEPLLRGSRNGAHGTTRVPTLDEILATEAVRTRFQPIIRLADRTTIGYETLAGLSIDSFLGRPDLLFAYAERKQRIFDLELACMRHALIAAKSFASRRLFMNLHPAVLADAARFADAVIAAAEDNRFPLACIVLELTEQGAVHWNDEVERTVENLQARGVRFAFDDVGMAYSHLAVIERFRPAYLKVSQQFGTGFEADTTRLKLVRNLLSLANDFEAELILEGIETQATADAARAEGIPLGQGFHLARPMGAEQLS